MVAYRICLKNDIESICFHHIIWYIEAYSPKWRKAGINFAWEYHTTLLDLSLNTATAQESWEWNIFKTRGLHFIHLNIHSLLPKVEEFWIIAKSAIAAIIGTSRCKLDESALKPKIQTDNYKILLCDGNWHKKV